MRRGLPLAVPAALLAVLLLAACGDPHAAHRAGGDPSAAAPGAADVRFLQQMIPHHQQAVVMAELAETRAAHPKLKDLAQSIRTSQVGEIDTMRSWLREAGHSEAHGTDHAADGMPGMLTQSELAELKRLRGARFDQAFLRAMIEHHQGAIEMAQEELRNGSAPRVKQLASAIKSAQQHEIDQMTAWQKAWFSA